MNCEISADEQMDLGGHALLFLEARVVAGHAQELVRAVHGSPIEYGRSRPGTHTPYGVIEF